MPPKLVASAVTKETLNVGSTAVVQSDSSIGRYQTVFEDDGETGYFYALDTEKSDNPIVDALHIYNVESVTDREKPSELHIVWSVVGRRPVMPNVACRSYDSWARRVNDESSLPSSRPGELHR